MFHVTPGTRARLKAIGAARKALAAKEHKAICDAREEGGSLREIAELVGLSHTEVRRIVERGRPGD